MSRTEEMPPLPKGGRVGLLCAVERELAPFLPLIEDCTVSQSTMLTCYSGSIGGVPVTALCCGICKVNAAIAAQILVDRYQCSVLINAGTAGGMDTDVGLLDTVVSTQSAYWDVDSHNLTDYHPRLPTPYFIADGGLLALAQRAAETADGMERVLFGTMLTGETFITHTHREEINARFAPLCVDMETAAIAHVCYVNQLPFLAVRTITDTAEHVGVTAFEANCSRAAQLSARLVAAMLHQLGRMEEMI